MRELRREFLIVIIIGFGSVLFSAVAMGMYREPPVSEPKIVLTARPATMPRESLVRQSQHGASGQPQLAAAPVAAHATPAPDTSAARRDTAPASTETSAAAPVMIAKKAAPEQKPIEVVPTIREKVWGEWVEVQDFRRGVLYHGEYEDFTGPDVPRRMRGSGQATP